MSSADLRYPRQTLMADYGRAAAGVLLCGAPLLLLDVNRWLALILLLGFLLFAVFLAAHRACAITRATCWGPTRSAPTARPAPWWNGTGSTG